MKNECRNGAFRIEVRGAGALSCVLLLMVALLPAAKPLGAQEVAFRAAVGAAIPVGGAREMRDFGPAATLSFEARLSRSWALRLDGDWSMLLGPTAPPEQEHSSNYQNLRSLGIMLNGIVKLLEDERGPYLLAGLGAYRLQRVDAPPSPYGTTRAIQAGLGVEFTRVSRATLFGEARALVHLTDYGGIQYGPTVYWPVQVGVRLR